MLEFKPFVQAVGRGEKLKRDLTYAESVEAMRLMLQRKATDAQIGAFLIAQRVKGESEDEIRGFIDVVRNEFMHPIHPRVENLLDLAAPYDGKAKTAQLAPAVALILVAAGVPVVLHGDEGVPTKEGVGPGTVLQALGVPVDLEPDDVTRQIESSGFGYLSAARYIPAWHGLLPLRRQFGLRTAMNTVEKLFNPANAPYQISGFFHANYVDRLRGMGTGTRRSWIVQGEEGSVEMPTGRSTHIFAANEDDDVILAPETVGFPTRVRIELPPVVEAHAALNWAVLNDEQGAARDQSLLTAGTILWLLDQAHDLADGITRAAHAIDSGAAKQRLEQVSQKIMSKG
jgi:anthranilate phosphoribosyltransferase